MPIVWKTSPGSRKRDFGSVHFYNWRGTAEQWIKEGKPAIHRTWLCSPRFRPTTSDCCAIGSWSLGSWLSFAKTVSGSQVVDLSTLIRRQIRPDDHLLTPPASSLPLSLRWPPPARPREPSLAPAARRVQENDDPAQASQDRSPLLGLAGQGLGRVEAAPRDRDPRHRCALPPRRPAPHPRAHSLTIDPAAQPDVSGPKGDHGPPACLRLAVSPSRPLKADATTIPQARGPGCAGGGRLSAPREGPLYWLCARRAWSSARGSDAVVSRRGEGQRRGAGLRDRGGRGWGGARRLGDARAAEVGEEGRHGERSLDGGEDAEAAATAGTGEDIEVEHAAHQRRPGPGARGAAALDGVASASCAFGSGCWAAVA